MGWILCVWPEGKEEWLSLQAEKSYHSLSHSGDSATWLEVASGEVGYYSISFWPVMEIQTRKVAFAGVWYMFQNGAEGLSSDRDFFSPRFFTTENAFGNVYGCSQPELGFLVDDLPSRAPLQVNCEDMRLQEITFILGLVVYIPNLVLSQALDVQEFLTPQHYCSWSPLLLQVYPFWLFSGIVSGC
ncbi:uncharacterized protein [Lolium perenne]|uniref:uncharacterized protein isoform X2 n=1 Tax=Lolium perenne TaxID=4522 RepID=UPI0021F5D20A|nr:uncharacterized protein LOC127308676 isoform X2 [Lolium perenne]XP_051195531.1 uncharacterized protein LOC127308676 isoform X2 [Lolium perenne]